MAVDAKRKAKVELTAGTAGLDSGLADAKRKMRAFQREETRAAKKAAADEEKAAKKKSKLWEDRRGKLGSAVGMGVGMALGGDIVSQFTDAVSGIADFERELTRFQIDAQLSGKQIGAFRDEVMATSEATGQSRIEILKGAHAYQILTGDADAAMKSAGVFAKVANASGSSMDDIAAAAASLHNNLGFKSDDMQQGFDVLLSMGHKANIELRDMGGEMNRLLPLFRQFGKTTDMNKLAEMAASFETIGPSFKGPEEAAEGFQQAMMQISKPKVAANFEGLGVKIWEIDPKTKLHVQRDWIDIIGDIKKKVPDKMYLQAAVGGRVNAFLAIKAMVDNYDRLVELKNEALGSDQVAKDNATYMNSTSGRIAVAWAHIKNSIAEALTPDRIEAFANALTSAADAFSKAVSASDTFLTAVGHMFGGGGGQEAEENTGLQDMFLNNTVGIGKDATDATEKAAIANAQDIIANPKSYEGTQAAHDYGGTKGLVDIARKYLDSEGIKDPWSNKGGSSVDQAKLADAITQLTPEKLAAALAIALRAAGIGPAGKTGPDVHVKIGAEPVHKAAANSIEHRRGSKR